MQAAEIKASAMEYYAALHLMFFSLTYKYETLFSYMLFWNTNYATVQIYMNKSLFIATNI
jgi:hypothetical protein